MKIIESKNVKDVFQILDIFNMGDVIKIDGRIYMSINSITEIGFLIAVCKDYNQQLELYVDSKEFTRIHDMVYDLIFKKSELCDALIKEALGIVSTCPNLLKYEDEIVCHMDILIDRMKTLGVNKNIQKMFQLYIHNKAE